LHAYWSGLCVSSMPASLDKCGADMEIERERKMHNRERDRPQLLHELSLPENTWSKWLIVGIQKLLKYALFTLKNY
jgi:hypothetical protein